jgi:hypothetical protein
MKPAEVEKAFKKADRGMAAISRLLQTGRSSIYRWKESGTEGCNAILLRLLASGKVTVKDIEAAHDH